MVRHTPWLHRSPHTLVALALVGSMFAACGGKTNGEPSGTGSSGGSSGGSGGSSGGGSGGSSGGGLGGSSGSTSGGGSGTSSGSTTVACVFVNPGSFDQTCNQSSDCVNISTGMICTGDCLCSAGAAINVSGESRYQADLSAIATGACPCPAEFPPACIAHRCTVCSGGPSDPPECGNQVITIDAGVVCRQQRSGSGGSGSSGGSTDSGPTCTVQEAESCSDGNSYNVTCTCPDAVCFCSESFGQGGGSSSGGMSFQGCADACGASSFALAYQACGFPVPQ